jgi:hypothetical protein
LIPAKKGEAKKGDRKKQKKEQKKGTDLFSGLDPEAGQEYKPSGSITLEKDGTITLLPPGTAP